MAWTFKYKVKYYEDDFDELRKSSGLCIGDSFIEATKSINK
jgi:hypothetical protein